MTKLAFDRSVAVVIGIDQYEKGIAPLRTAVADAQAISDLLEKEHDYEVHVLLDRTATGPCLQTLIHNTLPTLLNEHSRLLFYFAGHGIAQDGDDGPKGYLIPQNATPGNADSYLSMVDLHDALTALPCRHFLAIFDCCFAGAFRWSSTRDIDFVPKVIHQERFDRFQKDPAWQVITSASYDQKAMDVLSLKDNRGEIEADSEQHSPFAAALMQALQGGADTSPPAAEGRPAGDGVITATELYLYLRDSVEVLTAGQKKRQTPEICSLRNHDKGEYIFLTPGHELNLPPAPELNRENNPYRGLESFNQSDSDLFFGRDRDIEQLLDKVKTPNPLTVVLGVSGTGKSSLVKAGLLPRLSTLPEYDILPVMRPGNRPFEALAIACAKLAPKQSLKTLSHRFATDPHALCDVIEQWHIAQPEKTLVLVIDQGEELITQVRSQSETFQFQDLIEQAMFCYRSHFRIIATLRLDFEAQFPKETLRKKWMDARFVVSPMSQSQLREAIEQPAARRVLYFEPSSLIDELAEDVAQTPGALPLLSFTLSELYLRYLERRSNNRALTETDYHALGGVTGSLTRRAAEELKSLTAEDAAYATTTKHVMLRMIATEGGELARRRVPLAELVYKDKQVNQRVQTLLNRLVAARLIVRGTEETGQSYVEPAHDALVRGWDKLLRWRTQNQEFLTLQRLVASAAKAWKANNYPISDLWATNSRLSQVQEIAASRDNGLNKFEQKFIALSVNRRRQRRFNIIGIVSGVMLVLVGITILAVTSSRVAEQRRQVSTARQLAAQSDTAFRQQGSFLPRSLLLAIQSAKQFPTRAQFSRADIDQALRNYTLLAPEVYRFQHRAAVKEGNFSPDGSWIATASEDGVIQVWNAQSHQKHLHFRHDELARDVQFSPDSTLLATAGDDDTVQIWNLARRQPLTTLSHDDDVFEVRFSPNGQHLATASRDKTARIWNVSTGQELAKLTHAERVIELGFSPSGNKIVTASADKTAQIWNWQNEQRLHTLNHTDHVWDARFSPDGTKVATAGKDGLAHVWETASGKQLNSFPHGLAVWDVQFSPDGKQLATSSSDQKARIWALKDNLLKKVFVHESIVRDIRWSQDSSKVITASADGTARLWDTQTGEELMRMGHDQTVIDARFGPDDQQIITTSQDGTARLWDTVAHQGIARFRLPHNLNNVRFNPKGTLLAVSGGGKTINVWDIEARRMAHQFSHNEGIDQIEFSQDGRYLASASFDHTAKVWDLKIGENVFTMHHDASVKNVSWHQNDTLLVTASDDKTARIWDVAAKKEVGRARHGDTIRDAMLSPDGTLLATASKDKTAQVWDAFSGENLAKFEHDDQVWDVRFSPDGTVLATASNDGTGALWDVENFQKIATLSHRDRVWDVRFSHNGEMVATASRDSTAKIWDAKTGDLIQTLSHDAPVFEVSFSKDNQRVATASNDKTVLIWDIEKNYQIARIVSRGQIRDLRFSTDGNWLATVSEDGTARIHDLAMKKLMQKGCDRLTRNLTRTEWDRYIGENIPYEQTCTNLPIPPEEPD